MTAPDLTPARLEELLAAATPGPWAQNLVDETLVIAGRQEIASTNVGGIYDDDWRRMAADAALTALSPALAARVIELEAEAKAERLRLTSASSAALVIDVEGADQDGALVGWEYTATGMRFTIRGALAAALAAPRCRWLRDTPRPPGVPPWLVCVRDKCKCREDDPAKPPTHTLTGARTELEPDA